MARRCYGYNFDFVGTLDSLFRDGTPKYPLQDADHEGHWHMRVDEMLDKAGDWVRATSPDIVLLHAGAYDLIADQSDVAATLDDVGALIDTIRSVNPTVTILLAKLIRQHYDATAFNDQIPVIASNKSLPASPVIVVDQHTDIVFPDDYLPAGGELNESGDLKMAHRWFLSLRTVLTDSTPGVAVASPRDGDVFVPGNPVMVTTSVTSWQEVDSVRLYLDGNYIATDISAPYELNLPGQPAGNVIVSAQAFDSDGDRAESAPVSVTFGNVPPTITLGRPLDGWWYTEPADVTLVANVDDVDGSVSSVEFFEGTASLGSDAAPPFSLEHSGVTAGVCVFAARATDDGSASGESMTARVSIYPAGTAPFLERGGICVLEAEHYTRLDKRSDDVDWEAGSDADTVFMTTPSATTSGSHATSCEMIFDVHITTPGTYFIAARRNAVDFSHDTALLGIDERSRGRVFEYATEGWQWSSAYYLGKLEAGVHSIRIRRRESGLQVDRLMVALNADYLPYEGAPDIGLPESPFAEATGLIANAGRDTTVDLGETVTLDGSLSIDMAESPTQLNFAWNQIAGRPVSLGDVATATPYFTPAISGTYVTELRVSNGTHTSYDTVEVVVPVSVTESTEGAEFVVPAPTTSHYLSWADSSQIGSYLSTAQGGRVYHTFKTVTLDNGLIEVVVSPDLGMRVLRCLDKTALPHRQMFASYTNPANPVPFAQNIGGVKPNVAFAENSTAMIDFDGSLHCKAGHYIERADDGTSEIVMNLRFEYHQKEEDAGFLGKYGDRPLSSIVTVRPGHADFEVAYIVENENPLRRNNRIWSTALYPNVYAADGEWIFPTKWALGHMAETLFNIEATGPINNPAEPLEQYGSYFAMNPQYGFAGAYYPNEDANHLRVTDPHKYPGCKIYNHKNNGPPYELWGSTNNVFEVPENFVNAFAAHDLRHNYYLARGIGKVAFANERVVIAITGNDFSLTAPCFAKVDVYDYNQSTGPIALNQEIGPGIVVSGMFVNGLRVVAEGHEMCNVQLPLVFADNSADTAGLCASARRSGGDGLGELDASHGFNYELEDLQCKTPLLSSLASLLAIDHVSGSDDPDVLMSLARTAYRHGGFAVADQYLALANGQRPQQENYVRALMQRENGQTADFTDTPIEGNYFEALSFIAAADQSSALTALDALLLLRPDAIRPRLARAWLAQDISDALHVLAVNPGSPELWAVLDMLNYPGAPNRLAGLLAQNEIAQSRVNDFLKEVTEGLWRHNRRYEYDAAWFDKANLPEFPAALKYDNLNATPPTAPGSLAANAVSDEVIALSWDDNANNEEGFRIERMTDGQIFQLLVELPANTTEFIDMNVSASTAYTYRVQAYNSIDASAWSNDASATTPQPAPSMLLAYEGFDYATGALGGNDGGAGFGGAWQGSGEVSAPGWDYIGVENAGNKAYVANSFATREFASTLGGADTTLWMGFILKEGGNTAQIRFFLQAGDLTKFAFMRHSYDNWGINENGTGDPDNLPWTNEKTDQHFWLFKMVFAASDAFVTVWRDPNLMVVPTSGGTTIRLPAFSFDKVCFGTSYGGVELDELRIGTSFENVHSGDSTPVKPIDFAATVQTGKVPFDVGFTAINNAGQVDSWEWDFGDGGSSFEMNPTHTYATAGVFTVTLTATGAADTWQEQKPDYIAASNEIRIMALGNSITEGAAGGAYSAGYRRPLYLQLTQAGYDVNFVGSQSRGTIDDFDKDHEGHGGWYIDGDNWGQGQELVRHAYNWLVANPAKIVLLHIGTNDIGTGQSISGMIVEMERLLDSIDRYENDYGVLIQVFLAQITSCSEQWRADSVAKFNDSLARLAQQRIAAGDMLTLVDVGGALAYPDDLWDGVHPNQFGYDKIAAIWYTAVDAYLCSLPANRPPAIAAPTDKTIDEGQLLSFTVAASDPDGDIPSLSAHQVPVGAVFVQYGNGSASFEWTPAYDQSGSYEVIFVASDGSLSDTDTVEITVTDIPGGHIVIDNLDPVVSVQLYASSGWMGERQFSGNDTIKNLDPGTYILSLMQTNRRTRYVRVAVQSDVFARPVLSMRYPVAMVFSGQDTLDDGANPISVASGYSCAAMDDFDRDGDFDVVMVSPDGNCTYFLNDAGMVHAEKSFNLGISGIQAMRIVDINSDSNLDLVVALSSGEVLSCLNDGAMNFAYDATLYAASPGLTGCDIVELNADAKMDYLLAYASGACEQAVSDGSGWDVTPVEFTGGTAPDAADSAAILAMEVTGDSLPDLLISDAGGTVNVYKQMPDGRYLYSGPANCDGFPMMAAGRVHLAARYGRDADLPNLVVSDGSGIVIVASGKLRGDCYADANNTIDAMDLALFGNTFGTTQDDAGWVPACNMDLTPNGGGKQVIDALDLALFGDSWGNVQ
ncbi:MAG: PKD domain-containing protein [Chitinivibrionales bacterium]|nr:PKD domain-containing protein [Chitinivibrionales bacterium]